MAGLTNYNLLFIFIQILYQKAAGLQSRIPAALCFLFTLGAKDDAFVEMVQFHQSYSYEDFIMGYKPNDDGFELRTGTFYNFCKKAEKDTNPDSKYFFIIDEINRGKSFVEIQDESAEVDYVARLHLLLDGYTMSWPPSKLYWFSKYNSGTYSI